ncbi:MAG: hypothetical protein HYX69_05395 [Planctomycetia bacterium]|nr:hypothetical protein [Planctomycetia bacterium]
MRPAPALAAYLLGSLEFEACLALQQRLVYEAGGRQDGQISLLICEHPACITVGRHGSRADVRLSERSLVTERLAVRWVNRGGGSLMHAPGQLAVYPIVPLEWHGWSVGAYVDRLQSGLVGAVAELGFHGHVPAGRRGLWGRTGRIAAVGVAVKNWTTYYGAYVNVSPARRLLSFVHADTTRRAAMSSLAIERQQPVNMTRVREALVRHLAAALDAPRYHVHTGHSLLAPPRVAYGARARVG